MLNKKKKLRIKNRKTKLNKKMVKNVFYIQINI